MTWLTRNLFVSKPDGYQVGTRFSGTIGDTAGSIIHVFCLNVHFTGSFDGQSQSSITLVYKRQWWGIGGGEMSTTNKLKKKFILKLMKLWKDLERLVFLEPWQENHHKHSVRSVIRWTALYLRLLLKLWNNDIKKKKKKCCGSTKLFS